MIDIRTDSGSLIALNEIPDHLPKRRGKPVSTPTIWRWITVGISGHVLETVKIGGCRYTSLEAIQVFIESITGDGNPSSNDRTAKPQLTRSESRRLRDAVKAGSQLEAMGV